MHASYDDIRSRIAEPPLWFDEHAVPRYCEFHPRKCADIYANECALVEIRCQNCHTPFPVAFTYGDWEKFVNKTPSLADCIRAGTIHFGDPPNTGCCPAGPTMNCDDIRVLQFWSRSSNKARYEWQRDPALEIPLEYEILAVTPVVNRSERKGRAMKVKNSIYLYIALWGMALAIALLIISAGISAANLTGVTFGVVLMILGLFIPLAVFTGLVAKRLDVLAETGEDKPPLGRQ